MSEKKPDPVPEPKEEEHESEPELEEDPEPEPEKVEPEPEPPKPQYVCEFCGKVCASKRGLTAHKKACKKNPINFKKTCGSPKPKPKPKKAKPKKTPKPQEPEEIDSQPRDIPINVHITKRRRRVKPQNKKTIHITREEVISASDSESTDEEELINFIYSNYEEVKRLRKQKKRASKADMERDTFKAKQANPPVAKIPQKLSFV